MLRNVIIREIKRLCRQPIFWFAGIGAPLFCYVFFLTLMANGLPTDLPRGLVAEDATASTRASDGTLDAFQQTDITAHYPNATEARQAMQRGEIYGFYYIPRGTSRKAQRQEVPTVSFYTNNSFLVPASLLYRDMRTMSELASGAAARSVLYAKGATEGQAMAFLQPVLIDMHALGNPWLNYNLYLSNGILPGLLMIFIFMLTIYAIGTETKDGTARAWYNAAGGKPFIALLGKLLPQTVIFLILGTIYVLLVYGYLRFPCLCGIPTMLGAVWLFIFAAQGLGVAVYAAAPTLRLALSFASLWGVISFSIAGISFPVMAMHPVLQGLSLLFPLRHYFLIYVNSALNGWPLLAAWPFLLALLAFALLPVLLSRRLYRVTITMEYVP